LGIRYGVKHRPFWNACAEAFEAMFRPVAHDLDRIAPHSYSANDRNADDEDLTPSARAESDWGWYVTERVGYDLDVYPPYHYEAQLYQWFLKAHTYPGKPILLVHGRTGIGKTTFIRYFFHHYLPKTNPLLADNTYGLRMSMPVTGLSRERAENEFDHSVYKFLTSTFTSGQSNLTDTNTLIQMACLEHGNRPEDLDFFTNVKPPPAATPEQLRWIREVAVGRDTRTVMPVSDFADFNRLAIQYLSAIRPLLRFVFFLDNVDHLPADIQIFSWLMARKKMHWVNTFSNVSFIIAVRSYLLDNDATKENVFRAYQGQVQQLPLHAPGLYAVLLARKRALFDPIVPYNLSSPSARRYCFTFPGRQIPIPCPNSLASALINQFKDTKIDQFACRLTNFDVRQGIEIAATLFSYPFFDWSHLANASYEQFLKISDGKHIPVEAAVQDCDAKRLVSNEKVLDALLRKDNHLSAAGLPFFDNVFAVGSGDYFCNSLCKLFILAIIKCGTERIQYVREVLLLLGHKDGTIQKGIQRLLNCNIITSKSGIDLMQHEVMEVSPDDTTLCEYYYMELSRRLFYVQAMAYITPLDERFRDQVPLPSTIDRDDRTFRARVTAAHVLLQQIDADIARQKAYIEGLQDTEVQRRCNAYCQQYDFLNTGRKIKDGIRRDLENIANSGYYRDGMDELLELFH